MRPGTRIAGRTVRRAHGDAAERAVAVHLESLGWRLVARNVLLDGVEVDLVAVDPGPPTALVLVEVRSGRSAQFGPPEETVDRDKVRRLYRALAAARLTEPALPGAGATRTLARRVDLVVIDERGGRPQLRHIRGLEPPA